MTPWTYPLLDAYQRSLSADAPGRLLISEVAPVVTLGARSESRESLLVSEDTLNASGIDVYATDRGGLATYHGPGQWVVFPHYKLEDLVGDSRGVRELVNGLLRVAKNTAYKLGCQAVIRDGAELGVWTARGKLASVGIKIKNGCVLHGLSLNCQATPQSFFGIRPCGLNAQPAFLNVSLENTLEPLLKSLKEEFHLDFQYQPTVKRIDRVVHELKGEVPQQNLRTP